VGEAVREAADTVTPAADAKALALDVAIEEGPHQVRGDPERLQQIVWNLLSNAVKFTPHGGHVGVRVARSGRAVEICVADSGIGISAAFLPHVFERFRQEDPGSTRRFGGLGLGLAIVRNLVELHGGSITAESDGEGRGATFRVRLPAVTAFARQPIAAAGDAAAPGEAAVLTGLRVLVVDDEAEARELFVQVLERAGAIVTPAASVEEAIAALRRAAYHVLLSDIEMPGADGYGLARQALALSASRRDRLVAVAITAYSRPEDEARSREAGFVLHLRKPIDPQRLIAEIRALTAGAAGLG
jgi:CheY-like chemotaxis protein